MGNHAERSRTVIGGIAKPSSQHAYSSAHENLAELLAWELPFTLIKTPL